MKPIWRHILLILFSAALSWMLFFYQAQATGSLGPESEPFVMALTPVVADGPGAPIEKQPPVEASVPQAEAESPPEDSMDHAHSSGSEAEKAEDSVPSATQQSELEQPQESETVGPPPPEAGVPTGTETGEGPAEAEELAEEVNEKSNSAEAVMSNQSLLSEAEKELSGEARKGFSSVFLASAEEQLRIGQFFGETIVLVPKAAIDPNNPNPQYFQVNLDEENPRVQRVHGSPPLKQFRQYRDLFSYPYDQLPDVLRELRRSVLARNEVFLFGALIPPREWALAIDRRSKALAESGRDLSEVGQFVLRYVRSSTGSYDFQVDAIHFSDGTTIQPSP